MKVIVKEFVRANYITAGRFRPAVTHRCCPACAFTYHDVPSWRD